MKYLFLAAILLTGCGINMFAASTKVTYTRPDGTSTEVAGKPTSVKIHVDKATTPEEAIKAAIQANMGLQDLLKELIPLLEKGATAGS